MAGVQVVGKKEAAEIDAMQSIKQEIKRLEDRYEKHKQALLSLSTLYEETGTYITKNGGVLTVTERKGKEIPPDPAEVNELMKKMKRGNQFITVVQVDIKALRGVVGDAADKLIKRGPWTVAWSFAKE